MSRSLVTVVVPFVDHKDFIRKCCEELIGQNYSALEILLVNNGSADGSDRIAWEFAYKYPERFRVLNEERKGIPFARNKGLKEARGEFISFLDVDDRFTRNKLDMLELLLQQNPGAIMAYGQTERTYFPSGKKIIQDPGSAKKGVNNPPELAFDWLKSFFRLPQTGATLIRTGVARKTGGFPENLLLGNDDVGFHLNIALAGPVVYHPFVAVHYSRHEKSEGALLNNKINVHTRYLDAHIRHTVPLGKKYYSDTGDIRLLALAQKAMFLNYIEHVFRHKNTFKIIAPRNNFFLFYRLVLPFYAILPFDLAHRVYKMLRRPVSFLFPLRYPLT